MESKLKTPEKHKVNIVMLSILSVIFAFLSAYLGEAFIPLSVATLAALYLYDTSAKHSVSIIISAMVVCATAAMSFFMQSYVFIFGLEAVLLGGLISFCYAKKVSKAATALFGTGIAVLMIAMSVISVPLIAYKTFSWETVTTFYTSLYELVKTEFLAAYERLSSSLTANSVAIEFSAEELAVVFDSAMYMLISLVIIAAFVLCGASLKVFSAYVKKLDKDTSFVKNWNFFTPNVYAVFYVILTIFNLFIASGDVFGITVANLYLVFMFVYAYVGIKLVHGYFAAHHSKIVVALLISVILVCLTGTALQIFSLIGVLYTFYRNKLDSGNFVNFDSNKK